MNDKVKEKLAHSLTAESVELIDYIPYLLQDFWELGTPSSQVNLLLKKAGAGKGMKMLDLACGKGANAVKAAEKFGISVKGIDIVAEFTGYAKKNGG